MGLVAALGAVAALLLVVYYWWQKLSSKNQQFYRRFPNPPPLPLVGNALELTDTTRILPVLLDWIQNHGDSFTIKIGPIRTIVVVSDYKLLEFLYSSTKILNKSEEYRFFHRWLGTGLLTSDGPKWKSRRRILTPAFHFQILEQFVDVFESAGRVLVEKLEGRIGEASVDIYPYITLCALDIICESAMGTSVNAQQNEDSEYVQCVKAMCTIIMHRSTSPVKNQDFLYRLTPDYYKEQRVLKVLHKYSNDVINARREELRARKKSIADAEDVGMKKRRAFLDLLLEATFNGESLSQEDICEEVDTFMFEGHDTTASCIAFGAFCLANNPGAQAKALEEQKAIFGGDLNPESVTYTNLQDMKYLDKVVKETLRLYPSVPFMSRTTNQELEYDGTIIPKDVTFLLLPYGIHMNPKYFPDPERFNPDRFEDIDGTLPYAYIPFSAGPRNCIGQKFAMLEVKSALSKLLRKFEMVPATPVHKITLSAEAILKSGNGVRIGLRKRS